MELKLLRYSSQQKDTLGILKDETNDFFSYSIEDKYNKTKIPGQTRIPNGRYKLIINKAETPLTLKHRKVYNVGGQIWFTFHIQISGIPNFQGVYIHVGNDSEDTEGCLLLGNNANNNKLVDGKISDSTSAVKKFYQKYYPLIDKGTEVFLTILEI